MHGIPFAVAGLAAVICTTLGLAQETTPIRAQTISRDVYDQWMVEVSNAGRWGPTDELGTINLITPLKRRAAAQSVREGISVSLSHDLVAGPNPNAIQPLRVTHSVYPSDSTVTWIFDEVSIFAHGWAYTHVDGLSHSVYRGHMYNRFGRETVGERGAQKLGIQALRDGIVSRGVLIDLPRLMSTPFLEPGTAITSTDVEDWERRTGVKVEPGDVLLIRTGRAVRAQSMGDWRLATAAAGPHPSLVLWLKERGVAALGSDGTNELYPSVVAGVSAPVHHLAIAGLGMPLFDNLNLERLAIEAATRSRWTFMLVATPLRVQGASGSAVNPVAIF